MLEIPLLKGNPDWIVWIGVDLNKVTKEWLTIFLYKNTDIFAWFATDMPGIDLDMMVHKLNIDLTYCLVK